jgi:hypothetical protein
VVELISLLACRLYYVTEIPTASATVINGDAIVI